MSSKLRRPLLLAGLLPLLLPVLASAGAAPEEAVADGLVFPHPERPIVVAGAIAEPGELRVGRALPDDDPLRVAILAQLDDPFYRSLIRLAQCARNLAGDREGPNVLYLSQDEGGFAREGLVLIEGEGDRERRTSLPELDYVDLVVDPERLEGGELDIFSHELGHVMMNVLWPTLGLGEEDRLSRKMHLSMGITDPWTALYEGFGIHFQRLTHERIPLYRELFERKLRRADNAATWWHSTIDEELRLDAVLQNRYVFERLLPGGYDLDSLGTEQRILLAHATPIFDPTRLRNAQQMLASEGVLATLFYRIASSEELGGPKAADFYRPFLSRPAPEGVDPARLFSRFETVLLQHFAVWHRLNAATEGENEAERPLFVRYVEEWVRAFPEEREAMLRLFLGTTVGRTASREPGERFLAMSRAGLLGDYAAYAESRAAYQQSLEAVVARVLAGELRLDAEVGPTLWVEVEPVSVRHALWMPEPSHPLRFDLNTADAQELAALPGVDAETARRILARREELGFFRSLDDLRALGVEVESGP